MDRSTIVRTGVAGAVAAMGLSVGGVALATADTGTSTAPANQQQPGPPDGGRLASTLADQLGISESKVKAALDAVRDDLRPERPADGTRPTRPTEAEQKARRAAFVKALAAKLDVSEAKVRAALAVARSEARATERSHLKTRLDAAVKAGTLTEADEASVLKAFDARVIGDGPGGPGGPR